MKIWKNIFSIEQLNALSSNTILEQLGIQFTETGDNYLKAKMPVDPRTHQPFGILHGGASIVLAESLGSTASMLCINQETQSIVGVSVNGNHIRAVKSGYVEGYCTPVHLGQRTHVWDIEIKNKENKLVCKSRLTVLVLDKNKRKA